ncbi:hypothetical protein MEN41_23615 [Dolichospermum sp. ST_con]|nr:hypothetical protein [Dolichospermum sp. ST_con]MDD1418221.1 hypothetical protein [Dolichospermum sp. ST_sed1]MDD1423606.1 hypothetical protein [Dolichospermum sp. ST_sed9]MDD1431067.1 hypothetical protein [Dolichospermum sp. ST_sed6]MDD1440468.1 hypothetical protein [Dolichospermum sp. ST_sed3]MDD1446418.1 hypothetical protein [Dolichospermum sp. ST_sed8]MDD1454480.1 hypothetical protein [Dolichospermum sp. ST_sed7]MDD1459147.1 hypothetical protein [Dolichospermum sp. ST_sed2]MDD1464606
MQISEEITIKVSPNVAQAYQKATERKKQSLATLVSVFLRDDMNEEVDLLGKLMDEISDKAVSRGLTPEILETILNE